EPDEIRHRGVGELFGEVIESQTLETLALTGGLLALTGVVELLAGAIILSLGVNGLWSVVMFVAWIGLGAGIVIRYFHSRAAWTRRRLEMTNELVEGMVGYRTRLVYETFDIWHEQEDRTLQGYLQSSVRMDRAMSTLLAFVPRGWLLASLAALL